MISNAEKIAELERRIVDLESIVFSIMGAKKETVLYYGDAEKIGEIFNRFGGGKFKASDLLWLDISDSARGIGSWIGKRLNRNIGGYMIVKAGTDRADNSSRYQIKETGDVF